jgi:hypothetical protein
MSSVLTIVREFTHLVRLDLWQEHNDAMDWDFIQGIGVPEGYGISGSEWRNGMCACDNLRRRAHEVSENPSAFSKYTVEFATIRLGEFINLDRCEAPTSESDETRYGDLGPLPRSAPRDPEAWASYFRSLAVPTGLEGSDELEEETVVS